MYKIETHLHTTDTSQCGCLEVERILELYKKNEYDAICVTDHYNMETWNYKKVDIYSSSNKLDAFLEGYYKMKEASKAYDIQIILGAELRFFENKNDYLFYGFDPKLLEEPREIMEMGIVEFSKLARETGGFIVQAHPFRSNGSGCVPVAPMFVDGIEVVNNNPRHNSYNDRALLLAQTYGLAMTAGSDCHQEGDEGTAGIISKILPKNNFEMADLLRSGNYKPVSYTHLTLPTT